MQTAGAQIAAESTAWQPKYRFSELTIDCQNRAKNLQAVLEPILRQRNQLLSASEEEAKAVRELAALGIEISARRYRDIKTRTINRDAGRSDWGRVELYLDDRLTLKEARESKEFRSLQPVCGAIAERSLRAQEDLTVRAELWLDAFTFYDEAENKRQAKRRLIALLWQHAKFLAETQHALRVNFDRKYDRWVKGGKTLAAIEDRRLMPAERPDPFQFSDDEWNRLLVVCIKLDNIDLGWLEFLESEHARPETKQEFQHDSSLGRRRTPGWIRRRLENDVRDQQLNLRGPKTAALKGPYTRRDPNAWQSGDWDQGDDKTPDLMWWEETPEGLWFGQGQLIVWIDVRSWFIYGFTLRSDPAYGGFTLRNSYTDKALKWGLARRGLYLENGTWRTAKVFAGKAEELDPEESEQALKRLGLQFRHARHAKGKIIERVFGSVTDQFNLLPGYVGRNQMLDKFERVQKQIRLVKSGQAHPRDFFLSKDQFIEHLNDIAAKLNARTKHGEYHSKWVGNQRLFLSPQQAYEEFFGNEPLHKIEGDLAYLRYFLRCNSIKTTGGPNGVMFRFGKETFHYKNHPDLLQKNGHDLICRFDPGDPSLAYITDPRGRNPIVVAREPLYGDSRDDCRRAAESNRNFLKYSKDLSRMLAPVFRQEFQEWMFRHTVVNREQIALGNEFDRQRNDLTASARAEDVLISSAQRNMRELNLDPALVATGITAEKAAALERMKQRRREEGEGESL